MNTLALLKPFGVDIFCLGKKFLVFNLVSRNIKIKYRRSILGLFWTLLTPMAMAAVYYFLFKVILKVQIPHYLIFILSGMIPWAFFSQTVMEGMESLVSSWGLISKVPIPIQVFPLVGSATNFITFIFSIPIMILAAVFSQVPLGLCMLMLFYYGFLLFLLAYGVSLILAVAYVSFRDLKHITGILIQVWFYGTPVIYDEAMIPAKFHWVLYLNPVGLIFVDLHQVLARGQWPDPNHLIVSGLWVAAIMGGTMIVLKYLSFELVERI